MHIHCSFVMLIVSANLVRACALLLKSCLGVSCVHVRTSVLQLSLGFAVGEDAFVKLRAASYRERRTTEE